MAEARGARLRAWIEWLSRLGVVRAIADALAFLIGRASAGRREALAKHETDLQWKRVEEAFHGAAALTGAERKEYLDRACAGEPWLRSEVETLLDADRVLGPFDQLAGDVVRPVLWGFRSADFVPDALERYVLIAKLGAGGMGVVYRARDERLQRDVALKFLSPELGHDAGAKERFLREARAAARLEHPNICTIHEIGEAVDGRLFIAMPLYEGASLTDRIAVGALPVEEAIGIASQVLDGLAAAASQGIIHRDIKPANLIITTNGVVKLVDFGLAKLQHADPTGPGRRMGTVAYMSPEQARGDPVDARSDLWSVGVVLYEMLTGVRPFRRGTDEGILSAIERADVEPIRQLRPNVPDSIAAVVHRMLRRDPVERYGDAAAAASALRAAGADASATSEFSMGDSLPPEGERRSVSILACTIEGLDLFAERLPPDTFATMEARLRNEVADAVRVHGGILHEQGYDNLIALFGLPVAHEDDPARATRAALWIRRVVAACGRTAGVEGLGARVSVTTGPVVARGGRAGDMHVTGDVLPGARRIGALAGKGQILVDGRTRRRILGLFDLRPLTAAPIAIGDLPPLHLFVVERETTDSRIDSMADGQLTAFRGRDEELGMLHRELEHARAGAGRLVVVEGEPGLGKSRLVLEFRKTLPVGDIRVLSVRCHAHTTGTPYCPLADALGALLDLPADHGTPAAVHDLAVQRLREIDASLEVYLPLLLQVLGIPSRRFAVSEQRDEPEFRTMAAEAIASTFTLAGRTRALVLLVEDWHWADAASLGALTRLIEVIGACPMLAVLTSRPGRHLAQISGDPVVRVPLYPLGGAAVRAVIASFLGADGVHPELANQIERRTGGNPFFIEELCAAFIEEDAVRIVDGQTLPVRNPEELPIPDSVHAVVAVRLDRLPLPERRLVRIASVIGAEFRRSVLEAVWDATEPLEPTLEAVRASGMIQRASLLPEPLFRFRHALIRDVAYEGLVDYQRRELHRRVGEALEASSPGSELSDALAEHFAQAQEWSKAIRYARRAAEGAAALKEPREALRNLERAYEWAAHLEPDARRPVQVELLFERERFYEAVGDRPRQEHVIAVLLELLPERENAAGRAEVFRRRGDLEAMRGRRAEALAALEEADRLCTFAHDPSLEMRVLRSRTHFHWRSADYERARALAERLIARVRKAGEPRILMMDLQNLVTILARTGEVETARCILEEEIRPLVNSTGDPLARINLLNNLGNVYSQIGLVERALACHREAAAMPEIRTLPQQHGYQELAISGLLLRLDRIDEAVEAARAAVHLMRRVKHAEPLAQTCRNLAELLLNLGRFAEALPALDEALDLFERIEDRATVDRLLVLRARTLECAARPTDALAAWAQVRDVASGDGDAVREAAAFEGMSRCSEASDPPAAEKYACEALKLALRVRDEPAAARLCNRLAVLAWRRNDLNGTVSYYERAAAIQRALGDTSALAIVLNGLGATQRRRGLLEEARDALEEAIRINREDGGLTHLADGLSALGRVLEESGDPGGARDALEEALRIRLALGDAIECGWTLMNLARVAPTDGYTRAERLAEATRIAREQRDPELLQACEAVAAAQT